MGRGSELMSQKQLWAIQASRGFGDKTMAGRERAALQAPRALSLSLSVFSWLISLSISHSVSFLISLRTLIKAKIKTG